MAECKATIDSVRRSFNLDHNLAHYGPSTDGDTVGIAHQINALGLLHNDAENRSLVTAFKVGRGIVEYKNLTGKSFTDIKKDEVERKADNRSPLFEWSTDRLAKFSAIHAFIKEWPRFCLFLLFISFTCDFQVH